MRSAGCIHDDDSSDDRSLAIDDNGDDGDDGDNIKELCSGELVSKLQRNRRPKGGKAKGKDEARGYVSRNGNGERRIQRRTKRAEERGAGDPLSY